jgi:hypothetical protein
MRNSLASMRMKTPPMWVAEAPVDLTAFLILTWDLLLR